MPETEEVAQRLLLPSVCQKQAGVARGEQSRLAEVDLGTREGERLRQADGEIRDTVCVAGYGGPDVVICV